MIQALIARKLIKVGLPVVAAIVLAIVVAFTGSTNAAATLGGSSAASGGCVAAQADPGTSGGMSAIVPTMGKTVAQVAYRAGFRGQDLVTAVAVAKAESSWNATATNHNTDGSTDFGLWQINTVHAALLATGNWADPADNARMAYEVWKAAGGWTPWTTFNNQLHIPFLGDARRAIADADLSAAAVEPEPAQCLAQANPAGQPVDPQTSDPGDGPMDPPSGGLRPRAANVRAIALSQWGCATHPEPCVPDVGGYSYRLVDGTNKLSDHATGRAADIMLGANYRDPGKVAMGDAIAGYFTANARQLGLTYVIWNDRIWTIEAGAWRAYVVPGGLGGDNLRHINHVHVSTQ